jgi:hypothetical protein
MLLSHTPSTRLFRATMGLAGLAVVMGILVVLRYSRIPFFVYYPRFTDTVLVSESLDMLLFLGASLTVPLSLLLFALQPETRRGSVRNAGVTLVAVLAVWLLSLALMSRSPSLAVLTLFASTASVAVVNTLISDPVFLLSSEASRPFTHEHEPAHTLPMMCVALFDSDYHVGNSETWLPKFRESSWEYIPQ